MADEKRSTLIQGAMFDSVEVDSSCNTEFTVCIFKHCIIHDYYGNEHKFSACHLSDCQFVDKPKNGT